jgi:hypothetical protein
VSLPASNALAPASASHLGFGRPHALALGIHAHEGVLAIFRREISLQYPKLFAV